MTLSIFRIQFPVLRQNEAETYYDQNGRIVFTVSKGLTGVGLLRKAEKKQIRRLPRQGRCKGHAKRHGLKNLYGRHASRRASGADN
jgi:hypothetical protein